MRILIFAAFFEPFKGGYVNSVKELALRLKNNGQEVVIITANTHHSPAQEIIDGIEIRRLNCWNPQLLNQSYPLIKPDFWTLKVYRNIVKERWDIISTQTRFFPTSLLGLILAKKKKVPLVHTERGSCHPQVNSRILALIGRFIDHTLGAVVINSSQKAVAVSEAGCEFLRHLGNKEPLKIFNGIDTKFFSPASQTAGRDRLNLKKEDLIITFVGRLIFAKGVQDLIMAFQPLAEEFPILRLLIVGDGPFRQNLQRQASELALGEKIQFVGEKNKSEIRGILSASDIFVNPSYSEGLPTSVLEAAAMGLAIVATDVGGTAEIIEHQKNGLLIPAHRPDLLKKNLSELLKNLSLRQLFQKNARATVIQKFNWDKIAQQYLGLFKKYAKNIA